VEYFHQHWASSSVSPFQQHTVPHTFENSYMILLEKRTQTIKGVSLALYLVKIIVGKKE
jgi:hypothetical protein